jgi:hypothetical protein
MNRKTFISQEREPYHDRGWRSIGNITVDIIETMRASLAFKARRPDAPHLVRP